MTARQPVPAGPFTPKLVSMLAEGYSASAFRRDATAGLTVAIVALPLSMAIAIASGASPHHGLITAIVGGFLISALGGSRHQIGGPAGAFIVLVGQTIAQHGMDGLLLAMLLAGLMMIVIGRSGLGATIRLIPYPVVMGFTAGIAVIISVSQIRDFLGLRLQGAEPIALAPKLAAVVQAIPTINPAALGVGGGALALILILRRLRPSWPGFLIAVMAASVTTAILHLPVETIGSRFGALPAGLPWPVLPAISVERILAVLPHALGMALLGSIESLLSAVVADGMSGRRHRPGAELVAQGIANIGAALFGGICATGTIARTATNVRAGAHGPVAGMLHALFLLAFLLVAAPLASFIPLPALAAILLIVAWNMGDWHAMIVLARRNRAEALVAIVTMLLTVFHDLTEGIVVGVALGAMLFVRRMAATVAVDDAAGDGSGERETLLGPADRDTLIYRITGPLFFGVGTSLDRVLDRIGAAAGATVIDLTAVPLIDASGVDMLRAVADSARRHGRILVLAGARPDVRRALDMGLPHDLRHAEDVTAALDLIRAATDGAPDPPAPVPMPH